ncbi:MAG: hypothetical protein EOP49_16005, partial [Sphingobacteriales bacterium]
WMFTPSTGLWTWVGGEKTTNSSTGNFGTKGVAAAGNWPGTRDSRTVSFTDATGNFWMFGGSYPGGNRTYNDLWRFNPLTRLWTWMSGDESPNAPGNYGTIRVSSPSNVPPARHSATGWVEGNNLWVFGGVRTNNTAFADMWRYSIGTGQWTWMSGPQTGGVNPNYGVIAVPLASNTPGSRYSSMSWSDGDNLWLFGGNAYFRGNVNEGASDLWRYNASTNLWTYINGNIVGNAPVSYGLLGLLANPGNRINSLTWRDASGRLWLFGGTNNLGERYNDLWRFDPILGWIFVSGDQSVNTSGTYITKGSATAPDKPGARSKLVGWADANGGLILFGGSRTVGGTEEHYNDFWRFGVFVCVPPNGSITSVPANGQACFGTTVTLTASPDFTYQWYRDDVVITGANAQTYEATVSGVYKVMLNPGECEAFAGNTVAVAINPEVTFTAVPAQPTCATPTGSIVVTAAGGSGAGYEYSKDNGVTWQASNSFTALMPGSYEVLVRDANQCLGTKQDVVISPSPSQLTILVTDHDDIPCTGGNVGSVTIAGGMSSGYTYRIGGAGPFQAGATFPGLAAGSYIFSVQDVNGCIKDTTVIISEAPAIGVTQIAKTNISCLSPTGSVTITGTNGTSYSYSRDGLAPQGSGVFTGLTVGVHTFQIIDASSCVKDTSIEIFNVPNPITVTQTAKTNISCANATGSVTIAGGGGTTYTYSRDGLAPQNNGVFPGLTLGVHTFRVIDASTCVKDTTIEIFNVPNPITITQTAKTNISCVNATGSVTIAGGGGTTYTYSRDGLAPQNSGVFTGLTVGNHIFQVIDASTCVKDTTIEILNTTSVITVTQTAKTNISCANATGSVTIAGGGGTTYTYSRDGLAPQNSGVFPGLTLG